MIDKVQKIREEVARIQIYAQSGVVKQILNYIDEVQKEPVSEDLEKEIDNYIKDNFFGSETYGFCSNRTGGELDCVDVVNIARHFANWQKNKMTTFGWKRATEELNIGCIIWDESRHLHLYSDIVTKGQLYISMADILSLPGSPKEKEE